MKTKIYISKSISIEDQELAVAEKRIEQALDRFDPHIKDIQVSFHDINGEKGGSNDKECKIIVRFFISDLDDIVLSSNKAKFVEAVTDCTHRIKEKISKKIRRIKNSHKVPLKEICSQIQM